MTCRGVGHLDVLHDSEVPTAKWSKLGYGLLGQLEDHDVDEAAQLKRSLRTCGRSSGGAGGPPRGVSTPQIHSQKLLGTLSGISPWTSMAEFTPKKLSTHVAQRYADLTVLMKPDLDQVLACCRDLVARGPAAGHPQLRVVNRADGCPIESASR